MGTVGGYGRPALLAPLVLLFKARNAGQTEEGGKPVSCYLLLWFFFFYILQQRHTLAIRKDKIIASDGEGPLSFLLFD